ncbi:hypothetical protein [Ancylobacter mangrovi]|uniref:hypothetical protein n=1 Tax=Ancylobacter mangrovi TaxID=2972472 RepID=UPI002163E6CC|nr:hypothetical protein [Ancylobacter mangrovi]MCS0503597.1 hypothetical protein [Ancylobacter mangrovi]
MPTNSHLREEIDSGRFGDKVPFPDPATAPLGTDDEAAGRPATREEIAEARRDAFEPDPAAGSGTDERGRPFDDRGATVLGVSFPTAVIALLGVVVVLAALIAALITRA